MHIYFVTHLEGAQGWTQLHCGQEVVEMDPGGCAAHRQHQAVLMAGETEEVNTVLSEFTSITEQQKRTRLSGITKPATHHASSCFQIPTNLISEANLLGPNQVALR